nr:LysE family transporter [Geotalea toluenoxydans]
MRIYAALAGHFYVPPQPAMFRRPVPCQCTALLSSAFVVGLTNPKVIVFFMSFFPLFMTSTTRPVTLVIMMVHVSALCLVYQTLLVLVGDQVAKRLSPMPQVRLHATRLAGAALIVFGIKLALESD